MEINMNQLQFNTQISNEVSVSSTAQEQLMNIVNSEDNISGIRIFVSGGGCGGMTYGMTLVETASEYDKTLTQGDLNVYVDSVALGFLEGVEIDFQEKGANKSFVFNNVFAQTDGAGTCGTCGASGGGGCG